MSKKSEAAASSAPPDAGWRETIEQILMAIVLALLFRGFVAEAFVIPTGSMAPTLMGRHKDVVCPKCHGTHRVQFSASFEINQTTNEASDLHTIAGTCPTCRYTMPIDQVEHPNDGSFSGDRIIVSKFAYDFQEPKRWDVIVFKYPGNATQNYIKRLVGLPGEALRIAGGNVYVRDAKKFADQPEEGMIARKSAHPAKLDTLLQLVDDTSYLPQQLIDVGWPRRWQPWSQSTDATSDWETADGGRTFAMKGSGETTKSESGESRPIDWLRYRQLAPSYDDWRMVESGQPLPEEIKQRRGTLITDFYAYNTGKLSLALQPEPGADLQPGADVLGMHWVDDLAVECQAKIESSTGYVWLDLIRAGVHHRCRINVADGKATLSRLAANGTPEVFMADDNDTPFPEVSAVTTVRGPGSYTLRLSNCDHELLLWVNGSVVKFDGPTTYDSDPLVVPQWSAADPGDLAPAGIGSEGAALSISDLRIYRDKYYIATSAEEPANEDTNDYQTDGVNQNDASRGAAQELQKIYSNPESWAEAPIFGPDGRRYVEFHLDDDQFFPMGDNSPHSLDARLWGGGGYLPSYVHRDLLIGKALFIYWPHTWNRPIPFMPNVQRMGPIH